MKTLLNLSFALLSLCLFAQPEGLTNKKIQSIAFGSCSRQDLVEKQLWPEVINENPDLFIWLGDNIYGDSEDMAVLKGKYDRQKSHPEYQKLLKKTSIIGVWDDHDYGANDAGKEFPKKDESRDLLFNFLDLNKNHRAWKRKAAYNAHTYDFDDKRLKIIFLDARYYRDPLKKEDKKNVPNETGEVLGDEQWKWLDGQLSDKQVDFFIIGSGIQVLAKDHPYEKWANFPKERKRLLTLVREKVSVPLLFISGDRHISELSKTTLEEHEYPIYDATSSSLTHGWRNRNPEVNELREGEIIYDENFALLTIDWEQTPPEAQLKYIGKENKLLESFKIGF